MQTSLEKLGKAWCGMDCWFELCNPRKSSQIVFWRQKDLTADMGKSEIMSFLLGWVLEFHLTQDNTDLSWGNDEICLASVRRQDLALTLGANLDWTPQNVFISKLDLWDLGGKVVFTITGTCCTCHLPHNAKHSQGLLCKHWCWVPACALKPDGTESLPEVRDSV